MKTLLFAVGLVVSVVPMRSADEQAMKAAADSVAQIEITVPAAGFLTGLTTEERGAVGLEKLSVEQQAALDALVVKEVRLAREGDVRGFAGTFTSRRSETERVAAGLGMLTTSEKYQLDRQVSRSLATLPPGAPVAIARAPRESELVVKPFKWETHGFVQLEYGFGSGGRDYRAATLAVTQENPRTGTAFTFAYSVIEGDGWWWGRGCDYGHDGRHGWPYRRY